MRKCVGHARKYCIGCSKEIGPRRLLAIPNATNCVSCQLDKESNQDLPERRSIESLTTIVHWDSKIIGNFILYSSDLFYDVTRKDIDKVNKILKNCDVLNSKNVKNYKLSEEFLRSYYNKPLIITKIEEIQYGKKSELLFYFSFIYR